MHLGSTPSAQLITPLINSTNYLQLLASAMHLNCLAGGGQIIYCLTLKSHARIHVNIHPSVFCHLPPAGLQTIPPSRVAIPRYHQRPRYDNEEDYAPPTMVYRPGGCSDNLDFFLVLDRIRDLRPSPSAFENEPGAPRNCPMEKSTW